MTNDRPTLVVRQQQLPMPGWVIVAKNAGGHERQLAGVFATKSAAELWIQENPNV